MKLLIFASLLFTAHSYARCNGLIADHILQDIFTLNNKFTPGETPLLYQKEISNICMDNCYLYQMKPKDQFKVCEKRLSKVIQKYKDTLQSHFKSKKILFVLNESKLDSYAKGTRLTCIQSGENKGIRDRRKCCANLTLQKPEDNILGSQGTCVTKESSLSPCQLLGVMKKKSILPIKTLSNQNSCNTSGAITCMGKGFIKCEGRMECTDKFKHGRGIYDIYCMGNNQTQECPSVIDCANDSSIDDLENAGFNQSKMLEKAGTVKGL